MPTNGFAADEQLLSNLTIAKPGSNHPENFALSGGKGFGALPEEILFENS
jgi:hypothetical protein